MSMVEKVALAMESHCRDVMEKRGEESPEVYQRLGRSEWEELARAAIEAMRKPTMEMQQVVAAQWGRRTWAQYEEVIDAALKEQL